MTVSACASQTGRVSYSLPPFSFFIFFSAFPERKRQVCHTYLPVLDLLVYEKSIGINDRPENETTVPPSSGKKNYNFRRFSRCHSSFFVFSLWPIVSNGGNSDNQRTQRTRTSSSLAEPIVPFIQHAQPSDQISKFLFFFLKKKLYFILIYKPET